MGHLEQEQFVGSMAFNRFIQASPQSTSASSPSPSASAADGNSSSTNNDNNSATSGRGLDGGSAFEDDSDSDCIDNDNDSSRAVMHDVDEDDEEDSYVVEDTYVPGGGGVFEEAKEVALNVLRRDSIMGTMAQSFVLDADGNRGHTVGMERSGTTVTATEDVSVVLCCDDMTYHTSQCAVCVDQVDQSRDHQMKYRQK